MLRAEEFEERQVMILFSTLISKSNLGGGGGLQSQRFWKHLIKNLLFLFPSVIFFFFFFFGG